MKLIFRNINQITLTKPIILLRIQAHNKTHLIKMFPIKIHLQTSRIPITFTNLMNRKKILIIIIKMKIFQTFKKIIFLQIKINKKKNINIRNQNIMPNNKETYRKTNIREKQISE